jgi:hypothetical protein
MPRRAPDDTFDVWILPGSYRLVASLVDHTELAARLRKSREDSYRSIVATIPSDVPENDPRRTAAAQRLDIPYFFDAPYLDSNELPYHADIQLDVADQDVDGLVVSFAGLTHINAVVRFAQPWQGAIPEGTEISLQKVGADRPEHPMPVPPNGEVLLKYLAPGRYKVRVQLASQDLAIQSLRFGGTEIADAEIELRSGATDSLQVVVTDSAPLK